MYKHLKLLPVLFLVAAAFVPAALYADDKDNDAVMDGNNGKGNDDKVDKDKDKDKGAGSGEAVGQDAGKDKDKGDLKERIEKRKQRREENKKKHGDDGAKHDTGDAD